MQWLVSQGCQLKDNKWACTNAAIGGHLELLQWLRANDCPWGTETAWRAARNGDTPMLQWMKANGCPWDEHCVYEAAGSGHVDLLVWLRVNDCPWPDMALLTTFTAECGQLEVLKWMEANGYTFGRDCMFRAVVAGQLECVYWLAANRHCVWNAYCTYAAASRGCFQSLNWARRAYNCALDDDERIMEAAATHGRLKMIQWLRTNGCPWNETCMELAAGGGHLEALQWMRANGCPWDATCIAEAARYGQLEVIKWARANGCPWDESCTAAASNYLSSTNQHVIQWLQENGCPLVI
eukprot:Plantae.Rhodophyta-Palmaria_palmata.ctg13768.p1 GENE.Plantae.Rhodophyta-Palmaria_palmata.ctg13768~~Plantae.Rhodophyta-Palmaria_palmata.ctg13768.p1  ORF type:complete len:319 (-),score=6.47 Plantae.Rhodophyta-Palmaria_palmata.ctg13768:57-941(-)